MMSSFNNSCSNTHWLWISEGIDTAAFLAVILSGTSVESTWVQDEVYAAMAIAEAEQGVIVLPLLIEDCRVPALLRDKLYADFRLNYDEALSGLIQRIQVAEASQPGRIRRDNVTNDYSFDWGFDDSGRRHFRLYIVTHSDSLPAS